jgi:hypothetical protein
VDGEVIAEHAHTLFLGLAEGREGGGSYGSRGDVGEEIEIDGAFEGHGELIGREGLMDAARVDRNGHLYEGI